MRKMLLYYAIKYNGDCKRISKAILNKEEVKKVHYDGYYVTLVDDDYPKALHSLKYKPWVLFYEGNLALLNNKTVGVVGSRLPSEKGVSNTKILLEFINKEYVVISGLAKGIDALAHKYAIENNHHTVGVLGCGIDVVYPKENIELFKELRKNHLIISEYPKGVKPLAYHFPWRNRIVSALSDCLIVVEAKQRSGTMISVNEALELGKEVYCFPYPFLEENGMGCNQLIQSGCNFFCTIKDIEDV